MDLEDCPKKLRELDFAGDLSYQYRVDCGACGTVEWAEDFDTDYEDEEQAARDNGWHKIRHIYEDGSSDGAWICPKCWANATEDVEEESPCGATDSVPRGAEGGRRNV